MRNRPVRPETRKSRLSWITLTILQLSVYTKGSTTVEPPGGVVGLIQQSTYEGRCPLDNPCEMLTKASLLLLVVVVVVVVVEDRRERERDGEMRRVDEKV